MGINAYISKTDKGVYYHPLCLERMEKVYRNYPDSLEASYWNKRNFWLVQFLDAPDESVTCSMESCG